MKWAIILSMLMILIIGIVTYRSGKPTESVIITLVLLMIFYIVYGHYYYSSEGFQQIPPEFENLTPKQMNTALIINKLFDDPTFVKEAVSIDNDFKNDKITTKQFVDNLYQLFKTNEKIISSYNVSVDQFFMDFFEFGLATIGALGTEDDIKRLNKVTDYIKNNKPNALSVSSEQNNLTAPISGQEIKLTYKQQLAQMIEQYISEKYNKDWEKRIIERIKETKPDMENPNANLPQIVYNASLPEKALFDAAIKEKNIRDMTFDEFFIAQIEILLENNKNPKNPMYKFASKFEPLFQSWKVKYLATVTPTSAPGSQPVPVTEQSTNVIPDLNKLLDVLTPATSSTIVPNANAAQIGTVVNTSPGLQQGGQYTSVKETRTFPKPGPRCPQPAPQHNCACQQPIMPDGKPFDPNMYIRKDSIPCWNCQLPI